MLYTSPSVLRARATRSPTKPQWRIPSYLPSRGTATPSRGFLRARTPRCLRTFLASIATNRIWMIAAALRLFSGRALRCGFVALGRADLWWPWAFLTDSIGWKSAGRAAVRRLERRGQPEWLAARKVVRFLELLEE